MGRIAKWRQARKDKERRARALGKVIGLLFIKHRGEYLLNQKERSALLKDFTKRSEEYGRSEEEAAPPK